MITITIITVYLIHITLAQLCLFEKIYLHTLQLEITLTGWIGENSYQNICNRARVKFNFVDEILTCVRFLLHYCILLERLENEDPVDCLHQMRQHITSAIVPVQQTKVN